MCQHIVVWGRLQPSLSCPGEGRVNVGQSRQVEGVAAALHLRIIYGPNIWRRDNFGSYGYVCSICDCNICEPPKKVVGRSVYKLYGTIGSVAGALLELLEAINSFEFTNFWQLESGSIPW